MRQLKKIVADENYHKAYILQLINFISDKDEFGFFINNTGSKYCTDSRKFIENKIFGNKFEKLSLIYNYTFISS